MKLLMPDNIYFFWNAVRRCVLMVRNADSCHQRAGQEGARDLALEMANRGEGKLLDQFNNPENPLRPLHHKPGRKSRQQTGGRITPFCLQHGNNRHCHRRFTLYREQSKPVNDCWPAGRRQQYSRHSPLACEYLPGFSTLLWWMRCWIFISAMQKTPCANWRCGKEYSVSARRHDCRSTAVAKLT